MIFQTLQRVLKEYHYKDSILAELWVEDSFQLLILPLLTNMIKSSLKIVLVDLNSK